MQTRPGSPKGSVHASSRTLASDQKTAHPAGRLHHVGCKNHPNPRPFHPSAPSVRAARPLAHARVQALRLRPQGVGTKRNVPSLFLLGGTSSMRPSASIAAGVASVRVQFRPPTMPSTPRRLCSPPRIPAEDPRPAFRVRLPGIHGASPSSASRPRSGSRPLPVPAARPEIRAVAPSARVSTEARAARTASVDLIPIVRWRRPR